MNEHNNDCKHNGWANYETWAVNLWLANDETSHRYWSDSARVVIYEEGSACDLARQLKDEVTSDAPDLGSTLYADLLNAALSEVDWLEIAGGMLAEHERVEDVLHAYTRAEAISDGVLVNVTETASEAGFRYPVALTRSVYERYVVVPEGVEAQDERGRLWDVVYMCLLGVRSSTGSETRFSLHVRNSNARGTPPLVMLKALCGPGDNGEPVITIMLPDED